MESWGVVKRAARSVRRHIAIVPGKRPAQHDVEKRKLKTLIVLSIARRRGSSQARLIHPLGLTELLNCSEGPVLGG